MSKISKIFGLIFTTCGVIITYAVIFDSQPPNVFIHILALIFGISIILFGIGFIFKETNKTAENICYISFIIFMALTLILVALALI